MNANEQYAPIKLGSGTKVHAGREIGTFTKRGVTYTNYRCICSTSNTHNVNNHPTVRQLPTGTEITCSLCLAIMARREAQESI